MHPDAARPGLNPHQRAAAANLARHMVVIDSSLSGHLPIRLNTARTGLGIERQRGVASPQFNAA